MPIICRILLMMWVCLLSGCMDSRPVYAPVSEVSTIDAIPRSGVHKVTAGETLYSIAWRYGLDYHYLAERNHIALPYSIYTGQVIYLKGRALPVKVENVPVPVRVHAPLAQPIEPTATVNNWRWPAQGRVIGTFSDVNKGINIKGQSGDPIFTTAAGRVVYSGSGLRGYGNLIIIEHNRTYLTAYAHNRKAFVKEGDFVKAGQEIAEMGNTGAREVMLHFEIRRKGQPVNPLHYLGQKSDNREKLH